MENNKNSNKGLLLDVSSIFLVEGSADSEAPDDELLNMNMACEDEEEEEDEDDYDDAESCSCCRDCEVEVLASYDGEEEEDDGEEFCCWCTCSFSDGRWEPKWSSNNCKRWLRDASMEVVTSDERNNKKNNNCVEEKPKFGFKLRREAMDEMEDRLFWETCMAIGYP